MENGSEKFNILSASKLFDRPADSNYLEEWAKLLATPPELVDETQETAFVIFRLGSEWFGLDVSVFVEIASLRTINTVPHKKDPIILGVVNLRGQLRMCFSLHYLLSVDVKEEEKQEIKIHHPRLIAITDNQVVWTFPVDEVDSIYQIDINKTFNIPVNIAHSKENYFRGVVHLNDKKIYILNHEMLFLSLLRRVS